MPPDLVSLLRFRGRLRGGELAAALGVSRPTLMRLVRAASGNLVMRGQARRTTYAARRSLRGSAAPLPLFHIDLDGQAHPLAELDLTHPPFATALAFADTPPPWPLEGDMRDGWFDGLPYPLYDMRPQGFLGRHFARRHAPLLQVDPNPEAWTDDDVLHALSLLGDDVPGDLILGEAACRRWLERRQRLLSGWRPPEAAGPEDTASAYGRLAGEALAGGEAGSSAGGEFPKFTALRQLTPRSDWQYVLVKFSGDDDSPGTRRWADLLCCEHLAAQALVEDLQLPAASTRLLHDAGRTFLEVERFDRHGLVGRSPLVSWAALNGAFFGVALRPWSEVGRLLAQRGWLSEEDAQALQRLAAFGQLIANSDMHDGNLSFVPASDGVALTPVYDMLPMRYAPQRGVELPEVAFAPPPPLPAERAAWSDASRAALRFWERVHACDAVTPQFRSLAGENAQTLLGLQQLARV